MSYNLEFSQSDTFRHQAWISDEDVEQTTVTPEQHNAGEKDAWGLGDDKGDVGKEPDTALHTL